MAPPKKAKTPKRQPATEKSTAPANVNRSGIVAGIKDIQVGAIKPPPGSMLKKPKKAKEER